MLMQKAKLQIFINISKQYYLKLILLVSTLATSSILLFILFEQHSKSQTRAMTLVQMVSENQFELFSQSLQQYTQQVHHVVNQHKIFADINFPIASSHRIQSPLAYDLKHPHQTVYQALPSEIRQSLLQAFTAAINYDRPQMIKLLLAMELPIDEHTLLNAIRLDKPNTVQLLLESRAITANEYNNVIIAAINSNNLQIIDLLQRNGISFAKINLNLIGFKTRFFNALAHTNPEILSFFMAHAYQPWQHLEPKQVSHFLADLSQHKVTEHARLMLQILLTHGLPINHYNQFMHTPLTTAINLNSVSLVKQLINAGANTNSHCTNSNKHCNPPLWYAINQGNIEITQLLLNHGANPKLINSHSQALLQELLPTAL